MADEHQMIFPPELVDIVRTAKFIVVLTGAGTSAESGVPTFRDAQTGLWATYDPQQLATPQAFQANPRLVWEWYTWRRTLVAQAQPNPGHTALVDMEQHAHEFLLITQNVDGMHQRAGSKQVIELHGNLNRNRRVTDNVHVDTWIEIGEVPPRCPTTGSMLRPDVVWFGESLPEQALHTAFEAARTCDVFFSIGTSGVVQPAASLPHKALQSGATLVVINPDVTPHVSERAFYVQGTSGQVLPALVRAVWPETA